MRRDVGVRHAIDADVRDALVDQVGVETREVEVRDGLRELEHEDAHEELPVRAHGFHEELPEHGLPVLSRDPAQDEVDDFVVGEGVGVGKHGDLAREHDETDEARGLGAVDAQPIAFGIE